MYGFTIPPEGSVFIYDVHDNIYLSNRKLSQQFMTTWQTSIIVYPFRLNINSNFTSWSDMWNTVLFDLFPICSEIIINRLLLLQFYTINEKQKKIFVLSFIESANSYILLMNIYSSEVHICLFFLRRVCVCVCDRRNRNGGSKDLSESPWSIGMNWYQGGGH